MVKDKIYPVTENWKKSSWCNKENYISLYNESLNYPEKFWKKQSERIHWISPWSKLNEVDFKNNIDINWFINGKLNASSNCIDRHLQKNGNKIAIIWEGDDPKNSKKISYNELYREVCIFANILKLNNVKKGDRVTIYLPMIPEAAFAMLACSRIGAIHSVVFGGFSPEALSDRIKDCNSTFVITADEGVRGGKKIPLKENVDIALQKCPEIRNVLIINRTNTSIDYIKNRDLIYSDEKQKVTEECNPEIMDSEDPLFILYTSGSTGKPKGVMHTTAGYLVYASLTHHYIFDYHKDDIFWCTADVGWVTGHSYIIYGPLLNGATTVMFEGVPNYPSPSRFWEICDKHKITIFYTAPTAIRALMREGEKPLINTKRNTLRLLGSVGEPINPEAWEWYYKEVGRSKCPIVDTWWQTETGGILISALPGAMDLKPGSASLPFFGVEPLILDDKGVVLEGPCSGNLCFKNSWPGQMRTVYGNHKRFKETYFDQFPGMYFTGDGCKRDKDGYYWITGRVDDVINVSGHRLGTAEIESALVSHPNVAESAVVGYPHQIKGQGIYAYVTLQVSINSSDKLRKELINWVKKEIGPIASPDVIHWSPSLPKTRSGKIMRRILRKIAEEQYKELGDTSTLADPSVVEELINERKKYL
ncbi:MAG: acetate--CoA ligase [Rhodospirillaceae bacterium]|nr:acetate--CoA ligase [Rhodospirillaceae bacterium]|tara:strand:+ start:49985 stop:51925 length:1941 start_codon:yes stop_codon:yes gene_type:complete